MPGRGEGAESMGCVSSANGEQVWLEWKGRLAGQQQPGLWESIGRDPAECIVRVLSSLTTAWPPPGSGLLCRLHSPAAAAAAGCFPGCTLGYDRFAPHPHSHLVLQSGRLGTLLDPSGLLQEVTGQKCMSAHVAGRGQGEGSEAGKREKSREERGGRREGGEGSTVA